MPKPGEFVSLRCHRCDGAGGKCVACGGTGEIEVRECPKLAFTPDVRFVCQAADYAEHGSLPHGGGWLNESQSLLDAIAFLRSEQAAMLAVK